MQSHPRVVLGKGTRFRAVVYAPIGSRSAWIEKELAREEIAIETAFDVADVIECVLDSRPQIVVLDFDALTRAEILDLHRIRERSWFGTIFAIGKVPVGLRKSLRIEQVLPSLVDNSLRTAVAEIGFDAQTRRLPIFND